MGGCRMENQAKQVGSQTRFHNLSDGVSYLNQSICFKIICSDAKECYLNLYHKEDASKNKRIPMELISGSDQIFLAQITDLSFKEYEYCFEANGKEFLEPNVKVVYGREEFGVRKEGEKLRGGFLTPFAEFENDKSLKIAYQDLTLYKLHVRGFTKHESSKVDHPGTFLGVKEKIPYIKELGINAILLLPIVEFDEMEQSGHCQTEPYHSEEFRLKKEKINYWGFEAPSYLYAPKSSYAADTSHPDLELKQLIKELHENGIELLMEMNFTCQTNPLIIADCLSFWHQEYHIDGFKLNLPEQYRSMIAASPLLRGVKLLDAGWNKREILDYTDGKLPTGLAESNDGFLVDARRFLKGDEALVNAFMSRTKYNPDQLATINYITSHDGFTLTDVFTYDVKHNEANEENNVDGREYNFSWNCGVEGETKSRKILALRKKMTQNALLALFLSQGTPMLLAGDEFGNTQKGNNNAYCQDNEISWLDWSLIEKNQALFTFVQDLIQLRKTHPILRQEKEMCSMDYIYCGMPDISFHGTKAWQPDCGYYSRELGVLLCGKYVAINRREYEDTFYIIYNMHWEEHEFGLPKLMDDMQWTMLLATDRFVMKQNPKNKPLNDQRVLQLPPRTICVLIGRK